MKTTRFATGWYNVTFNGKEYSVVKNEEYGFWTLRVKDSDGMIDTFPTKKEAVNAIPHLED